MLTNLEELFINNQAINCVSSGRQFNICFIKISKIDKIVFVLTINHMLSVR